MCKESFIVMESRKDGVVKCSARLLKTYQNYQLIIRIVSVSFSVNQQIHYVTNHCSTKSNYYAPVCQKYTISLAHF